MIGHVVHVLLGRDSSRSRPASVRQSDRALPTPMASSSSESPWQRGGPFVVSPVALVAQPPEELARALGRKCQLSLPGLMTQIRVPLC